MLTAERHHVLLKLDREFEQSVACRMNDIEKKRFQSSTRERSK